MKTVYLAISADIIHEGHINIKWRRMHKKPVNKPTFVANKVLT